MATVEDVERAIDNLMAGQSALSAKVNELIVANNKAQESVQHTSRAMLDLRARVAALEGGDQ